MGRPPSPYYTSDSECINSVMHCRTQYKASQWHEFNSNMQELMHQSYQLLELAVLDKGGARLRPMYKHLIIDQIKVKMTSKQQQLHLSKVAKTEAARSSDDTSSLDSSNTDYLWPSPLPISPDEAGLSDIPLATEIGI